METYEFEGKNKEEVISEACRQLHLSREELNIEIIEPGSAGIFGLVGARKAKIRVHVLPKEPPPPPPVVEEKEGMEDTEGMNMAKAILEQILALIPIEGATVSAEKMDGAVGLHIQGDASGLLIGRKGRTLDAIQFIVNKILNKNLERRARVVVDSENYRERRRDYLIDMAARLGDKAKSTGKTVTTGLLNPHDRRIVHLALRDDRDLDTKGTGEGVFKKIIIIPKKGNLSRPQRAN